MTDEKENILSRLDVLIKHISETPPIDLTPEVIVGDLQDIKSLINDNLN